MAKYDFCTKINRHLCFNREHIQACTTGNNTKNQSLLFIREKYNGEYIDWDAFFDEQDKIKKAARNGILPDTCIGCHYLKNDEWDNIDVPRVFKDVMISHYLRCNSNCIYCGNHIPYDKKDGKKESYDSYPVIKDLVEKGYINSDTVIDFAGGEPTLYYRFDDILSFLVDNNINNILVNSNCILYSKAIEKGIKAGKVSLCVSIDAGSKEVHKLVKGVPSYDKVWKHLKMYSKTKSSIYRNTLRLKFIVIPDVNDSEKEIDLFIQNAKNTAVDYLILNADNNIFIKEMSEEERRNNLSKVVKLSEYFISKCKQENISFVLEFNVRSAYTILNKNVPANSYSH